MSLGKLWKTITAAIERAELQTADIRREPFAEITLEDLQQTRAGLVVMVPPPSQTKTKNACGSVRTAATMQITVVGKTGETGQPEMIIESAERVENAILAQDQPAGYVVAGSSLTFLDSPDDYKSIGVMVYLITVQFARQQSI